MKIKVQMTHERETKRTHRYQEIDDKGEMLDMSDAEIGSLYIKKSSLSAAAPQRITVVVEG